MTDTELKPQPPPTTRLPPALFPEPQLGPGEASTAASVAPGPPLAEPSAPELEPPPAPTRRVRRGASTAAVTVPWESALPGVRSSEIRAELARREQRTAELLEDRERLVAEMDAIEAALDSLGEDAP